MKRRNDLALMGAAAGTSATTSTSDMVSVEENRPPDTGFQTASTDEEQRNRFLSVRIKPPTNNLDRLLTREVGARALSGNPEQLMKLAGAIGALKRISETPISSPKEVEIALARARSVVSVNREFTPEIFNDLTFVLGRDAAIPGLSWIADVPKGFGIALGIGSSLIGLVNKPAGAALSILGKISEPAFGFLSQEMVDSTPFPSLPKPTYSELMDANRLVMGLWIELASDSGAPAGPLQLFLSDSQVQGALGITLNPTREQKDAAMPPVLKRHAELLDPAVGPKTKEERDKACLAIAKDIYAQSSQNNENVSELLSVARQEREVRLDAERTRKLEQQLEHDNREVIGAIIIGGAIIQHVIGDTRAAEVFTKSASALQQAIHTHLQFRLDPTKIGAFAVAGAYVAALSVLAELMNPTPDPFALLNEAIAELGKRLSEQLRSIQIQLNERLDKLERQQIVMIELLQDILREVLNGQGITTAKLKELQDEVGFVTQVTMENERSKRITEFYDTVGALQNLHTDNTSPIFKTSYLLNLSKLHNYAIRVASEVSFSSTIDAAAQNLALKREISNRARPELLFGLLPGLESKIAVLDGRSLPNPLEWARGCNAYLEATVIEPSLRTGETDRQLRELLSEGRRLQSAVQILTSKSVLEDLAKDYAREAGISTITFAAPLPPEPVPPIGIVEVIDRFITDFEKRVLRKWDWELMDAKTERSPEPTVFYFAPISMGVFDHVEIRKNSSGNLYLQTLRNDPFLEAMRLGLIELRRQGGNEMWFLTRGGVKGRPTNLGLHVVYSRYTAAGQAGGPIWIENEKVIKNTPIKAGDTTIFSGSVDAARGGFELPHYLYSLIQETEHYRLIRNELIPELKTLLSKIDLSTFERLASSAQLFRSISAWRGGSSKHIPHGTDIANSPSVIGSAEEIVALCQDYLDRNAQPTAEWVDAAPKNISLLVAERLGADARALMVDAFVSDVLPQEQGIDVVDETLRRLRGYMMVHNIPPA